MPRDVPHAWKSTGAETGPRPVSLHAGQGRAASSREQHRTQRNFAAMSEAERADMLQRHGWELTPSAPRRFK